MGVAFQNKEISNHKPSSEATCAQLATPLPGSQTNARSMLVGSGSLGTSPGHPTPPLRPTIIVKNNPSVPLILKKTEYTPKCELLNRFERVF